jgi:lipopolysaccharide/colanic/teichoic acid biosynthesis glycosyltransferase
LPQLFNVLRGDMSIVGPCPHAFSNISSDSVLVIDRAKPGITGWAQVNGYTGDASTIAGKAAYELDRWYVDHQSLSLDLLIIWRTLKRLFEKHDPLQHSANR